MEVSLPQWNPVKLISPSRIKTFQECPKKYDYIYNQELVSKAPPKGHFNKGNYVHELLHVYYQLLKSGAATPGSQFAELSITRRIQTDIQIAGDRSLIPVYGVCNKTLTRYIREQSRRIDATIDKIIGIEHEMIYPFTDLRAIFGYADLIYVDRSGNIRVRDHKSGEKAKKKTDAVWSMQLLMYATILWKLYGQVPIAEMSYLNTKEYASKAPSFEQAFTFNTVTYTAKELQVFFDEICRVIDKMLSSTPDPHYGEHCAWCPFQDACLQSRKGIDPQPILDMQFKHVPRATTRKHESFTQQHTPGDNPS